MSDVRQSWFAVRQELPGWRRTTLNIAAFIVPLLLWSAISYVPFIWHPKVLVTEPGDTFMREGQRYEPDFFAEENEAIIADGKQPAVGVRANPVFVPAPHEVATGLVRAWTTQSQLRNEPRFSERLWHSIQIIFWGFLYSCIVGVPLGIMCGAYDFFSKLIEPFVDFVRYMPAPAFVALLLAIFGMTDMPKIALIFIGTFFQMVLMIANTTRQLDRGLLEAAQTLGASNKRLLTTVVLPGILPNLYNDLRILLGWAWTYLIIAELIGEKTGISAFITTQGRYFNFDLVYAALIVIGIIGLITDQVLQMISTVLFPWQAKPVPIVMRVVIWLLRLPLVGVIKFFAVLRKLGHDPHVEAQRVRSE